MTWLKNYRHLMKSLIILTTIMMFTVTGFTSNQINGNIVAAGKYRVEQITEADVQLVNPEYFSLLQNDQVLEMIKNNSYRHTTTTKSENAFLAPIRHKLSPFSIEMQEFMLAPVKHKLSPFSIEMQEFMLAPVKHKLSPFSIEMQEFMLAPVKHKLSPFSIEMQGFLLQPFEPQLSPYEIDFESIRMAGEINVLIHY